MCIKDILEMRVDLPLKKTAIVREVTAMSSTILAKTKQEIIFF